MTFLNLMNCYPKNLLPKENLENFSFNRKDMLITLFLMIVYFKQKNYKAFLFFL